MPQFREVSDCDRIHIAGRQDAPLILAASNFSTNDLRSLRKRAEYRGREGRPVHTGTAIFTPSIDLEGNISVSVRVDKRILSALNAPQSFAGKITNSANIGKSSGELVAMLSFHSTGGLFSESKYS